MYEGVDLNICLLLPRGVDLILPRVNYVPVLVHVAVVHLYLVVVQYQVLPCLLDTHDKRYINYVYLCISSPYVNPNMNSTPKSEF